MPLIPMAGPFHMSYSSTKRLSLPNEALSRTTNNDWPQLVPGKRGAVSDAACNGYVYVDSVPNIQL